jgi:peptidase S41-like protein
MSLTIRILLLACSAHAGPDGSPPTREQRWSTDIRYLVTQLSERHANLYHSVRREDFEAAARRLEKSISSHSDARMVAEIARLVAMVGDGHTGHFIPWDRRNGFRKYPLELWMAPEGPMVISAPAELSELAGAVITRLGRSSPQEVEKAIRPLLPADNGYGAAGLLPAYIVVPELLHALGLIDDMERLTIQGRNRAGRTVTAVLRPVAADAKVDRVMVQTPDKRPPWLRDREEPYWLTWLDSDKTLYIQYNDASVDKKEEPFAEFCRRVRQAAESKDFARIVVDLRWNDGGSLWRARSLLHTMIQLADRLPEGKLFVIAGRVTFSAATLLAVEFEQHTRALFVGEPTAGRPNGYGEIRRFRLPQSGLEIRYSAWRYQPSSPGDTRAAIMPDLAAVLTAADYNQGVDTAMEAIRAYRPRTPIREVVREIVERRGAAAALEEHRRLESESYNAYVFGDEELDAVARELLEKSRPDPALTLLAYNAERYPDSARAYASLADALARSGRCGEAREPAERAFALDKSYWPPAERLARSGRCPDGAASSP